MSPDQKLIPIPGSEKKPMPGARILGASPANERLDVTVRVRPRTPLPAASQHATPRTHLTEAEYAATYGSSPEDLAKVEAFAKANNLAVVESSSTRRSVILAGTVADFNKAFGVDLHRHEVDQLTYRGRTGTIQIPADLKDVVEGVFGLDDRPFAHPRIVASPAHPKASPRAEGSTSFEVTEVAALYNFPAGLDGTGQTIGIIELGGGYRPADLKAYFKKAGLNLPKVVAVGVDGGGNHPGGAADGEVVLDIEIAGAVAPGATIAVYFAPDASDQSFLDALTQAIHDTTHSPSVISISWGGPEAAATSSFQQQFDQALQAASLLGITVCVAAGDNGAADVGPAEWDGKAHVDFPASSAFALACGGTNLAASGNSIASESVWNQGQADTSQDSFGATGGGVSEVFPVPDWQAKAGVPVSANTGQPGRGVPDVAGDADPASGYNIILTTGRQRQTVQIGGTSAVAPLWAGLIARINQQKGGKVGFINPTIYALPSGPFHDITVGSNRVGDASVGYDAGPGWDACTGLGSPDGTALMNALLGVAGPTPAAPKHPTKGHR